MKIPLKNSTQQMKPNEEGQTFTEVFQAFEKIKLKEGKVSNNDENEANTSLDVEQLSPLNQKECFDSGLLQAIESKLLPSDLLSSEDE